MRPLVLISLLLLASAVHAQEEAPPPPQTPDYSRDKLLQLFADAELEDEDRRIEHQFGAIDVRAFRTRFRFGYLPFLAPLAGSMPWVSGHRWPDPFALTNTSFPYTSRTWRRNREMSKELRAIEKRVKASATVVIKP